MRRLTMMTAALSVLLLPLLVGVGASPAQAFGENDATQYGQAGDCFASAGPNYLGLRCLGRGSGDDGPKPPAYYLCNGQTPKPLGPNDTKPPNCDAVPECWNAPLSAYEQEALGLTNTDGPPKITYYWVRCLHGISKSMQITGAVSVAQGPVAKGETDGVVNLTTNQTQLLQAYVGNGTLSDRIPPQPIARTSPALNPRVNTDVSFYDSNATGSVLTVTSGGVRLQAREMSIEVEPLGKGIGDAHTTPGTCERQRGSLTNPRVRVGWVASVGQKPSNTPGGCWYKFEKSSASANNNVYQAYSVAHWKVYQKVGDGPWEPFRNLGGTEVEFDKQSYTPIQVTEVQSINYLPLTGANG